MKRFSLILLGLWLCTGSTAQERKAYYQVPGMSKASCCCGQFTEIFFPNLDFEADPLPGPGTFFTYGTGANFGGWTVTRATIDHCHPLVGNLGAGNPNGATYFVDLHGSPGLGGISYNLFGLTPGNQYRIEFWTAQNGSGFSSDGNLKIGGGAWLNANWTVSVSGAVAWRKEMFEFTAQAASTVMEFSSTGPMVFQGTLIDDIKIFECPGDVEKPEILNIPDDLEVECDNQVPRPPTLLVSDNCDPDPTITFKETRQILDPCTKKITREWTVKDDCDNETVVKQIIDVIDQTPADFTRLPENKNVNCDKDIQKEFNDWLKKNGNAVATDACGPVTWRTSYDRPPRKYCDTVIVEFIATNPCGLENSEYASFFVIDTLAPKFVVPAQSKNYSCIPGRIDSLRAWLNSYAFSKVSTNCDTVILSHNFVGDSTKNPIQLTVYAQDRCGHVDSSRASFLFRGGSDTFRITQYSCTFPKNTIDTAVFSSNGCDSIVITENIRRLADSSYLQFNTCDPQQPLFDTARLSNRFGCDSLVFSRYTLQSIPPTLIQNFDCTLYASTKDTVILQGRYCDSLVITENIPLRRDSSLILQSTCDSAKAGIQILQLTNILGCDSIVTIQTELSTQQITSFTVFECGLQSPYTDTVVFSAGTCDSLVVTTHIGLRTDTTAIFGASCDPSQTGNFRFQFVNRFGCDSIVLQTISLLPSDSVRLRKSTCILSEAGIDIQYLKNKNGCDSIVTTRTDFLPSDTTRIQLQSCDILQAGFDTLVFSTATCDSVVFLQTLFIPSDTTFIQRNSCLLSEAGRDTLVFSTATCDSVVFVQTNFVASDTLSIQQTTCDPNQVFQDTLALHNRNGCDSIVYRNIRFVPLDLFLATDSISCFGSNDGRLQILNWNQLKQPVKVYLNNQLIPFQQSIQNLAAGNYTLRIEDGKNCVSGELQFDLFEPTPLQIDLGPDLEVGYDETVRIPLTSNKALQQVSWRPFACNNCSELLFKARQENWIYVEVLDENGCPASDSILVRVRQKTGVFAPNAFSPNGDNINDYFFIQGVDGALVETLFIYDRWGEKVYEGHNLPVNDPTAGWNGRFKEEPMNPGVFIYYAKIKVDAADIVLYGDVSLIR